MQAMQDDSSTAQFLAFMASDDIGPADALGA